MARIGGVDGSCGLSVEGRILPEVPFVEVTEQGQALNFDIVLTNRGECAVELTRLEVTFVGDSGGALTRRLDGNGVVPAIEAVPRRWIQPRQTRLVFNPVEYAPVEPLVVAVRVAAILSADDSSVAVELGVSVRRCESAALLLPLAGRVWVWDGHDHLSQHRRFDYTQPWVRDQGFASNAMRYAYDLVRVTVSATKTISALVCRFARQQQVASSRSVTIGPTTAAGRKASPSRTRML